MKSAWNLVWVIIAVIGEMLLWYLKNADIVPFSSLGFIIGFVITPVIAGLVTVGIKYLLKLLE
ncbi:MAG: hypothetical protein HY863_13255 [Chloroflexi bacterium]|nr:hypothetical protein [Chloroflexota bacterium]